jgi:hypothetical protein
MLLAFSNFILFLIMVTMNALANILLINGKYTGQISDSYPNLFVPAGITFSIWGVIYLLLLIFSIASVIECFQKKSQPVMNIRILMLYAASSILNSFWILAWHYELMPLSMGIMAALLMVLILIFLELEKNRPMNLIQSFVFKVPMQVYLGWITVATIANLTALLVSFRWNGFGIQENIWTVIVMITGCAITTRMLFRHKNIPFALVVIWAYTGIILKRLSIAPVNTDIIAAGAVSIGVIGLFIIGVLIVQIRRLKSS